MKITEADVEYVAGLANLELGPAEKAELAAQLSSILDYIRQLDRLDVSNIEPTSQAVVEERLHDRDDRVAFRAGGSEAGGKAHYFKVPKVIMDR